MARSNEEKSSSFCAWLKIGAVFLLLAVGGILIWQFAPIDEAIDSVLPKFNNTGGAAGGGVGGGSSDVTDAPTEAPEVFQFQQCNDPTSTSCCNGLDNGFCDMRVDQVLYASSHNANAAADTGFLVSPNHKLSLEDSLVAGYRGINVDVCNCGGSLTLCHGICSFGTRDIVEVMLGINDFLDQNPSEVIILPMEMNSEVGGDVDIFQVYDIMQEVPGFVDKFYVHANASDPWPTLGTLVETNKRVIVFHFRGDSCDTEGSCPPGMHWYWRYASNTQFELSTLEDVADSANACTFQRTPGIYSKTFFGLNNFVSIPSQSTASVMNEYDYIANRIQTCSALNDDLDVNFVYVDFWSEGDLPRLVQDRNRAMTLARKLELD